MIDLFKGELLRFRLWAIVAFVANLVVLGFLSRMVDMAQQPIFVYQIFAAVYALAGALLGLAFMACTLVITGLPPLSGFVGKFAMLTALLNPLGLGAVAAQPPGLAGWLLLALLIGTGLIALCQRAPHPLHQMFAGQVDKSQRRLGGRSVLRALRVPDGDYRDWTDVRDWARSIAATLSAA